jgi:Uma2 family endonuclease
MQPSGTLTPGQPSEPPDHLHLPETDGSIVENYQEHPQANLLTECLRPRLLELRPDKQYCIGCDSGIYWRWTEPVLDGCKSPDWFVVLGVPPMLDGEFRRSYVLWREGVRPLIVIEFVSGDGRQERDSTPQKGKFWVYERGIAAAYYAIYEVEKAAVEVYRLQADRYHLVPPNAQGRYPIEPLGVELGIWEGEYREMRLPWLRVWDAATGALLPLADERADAAESILDDTRQLLNDETERAETERKRADSAEERARKLAEKLRALGIDPEA